VQYSSLASDDSDVDLEADSAALLFQSLSATLLRKPLISFEEGKLRDAIHGGALANMCCEARFRNHAVWYLVTVKSVQGWHGWKSKACGDRFAGRQQTKS
jgi:hypothetical protein